MFTESSKKTKLKTDNYTGTTLKKYQRPKLKYATCLEENQAQMKIWQANLFGVSPEDSPSYELSHGYRQGLIAP